MKINKRKAQFSSYNYILPYEKVKIVVEEIFENQCLKNKKVLDAGCRLGEYTRVFKELGAIPTGIDFNTNCIRFCKNFSNSKSINYFEADITDLGIFSDNYFDVIFCVGVAPYLKKKDLLKTIRGFQRVLKKNGKVILMFQKKKSISTKIITNIISLIPQFFFVNFLVPILDRILFPIFHFLYDKDMPRDYFRYGYLISLQNVSYGYPEYLENFRVNCPNTGLLKSKYSCLFIFSKKEPNI